MAIVSLPDGAWDRDPSPRTVHVHDVYDETILVTRGSGTVLHGPDEHHIIGTRFERPVVIVVPAGSWHHVGMDPAVPAEGTSFYTVAGTVIEPFAVQSKIVTGPESRSGTCRSCIRSPSSGRHRSP